MRNREEIIKDAITQNDDDLVDELEDMYENLKDNKAIPNKINHEENSSNRIKNSTESDYDRILNEYLN